MPEHWGINAIVYGSKGVGKSWVGDSTPAPRLVLDAEGGSRFTPSRKRHWDPATSKPPEWDGSWDTALVPVRDYRTLEKAYEWVASGQHPFKSVVMDSISEIQQRCIDQIAGVAQMKQDQWGQLLRTISDMARKFRDLLTHPAHPLDAVVIIAMARRKDDVWEPYVQGSLSTVLPYYFDICGYLAPVPTETGTIIRRLFIGQFPGYVTGERVGGMLGEFIDNPDVSAMLATVRARLKEETSTAG